VSDTIINERFSDLDYPGKTPPKNRGSKEKPVEANDWDEKPVYYKVNGVKQEFFTISHLAKALGYSVQSIRAWEAMSLLPRSGIRGPRTVRPVAAGRSDKGKRLWTREQIEAILAVARKHKVLLNKEPPTPAFCADVARSFEELAG
jgi:hypothetical protein